MSLSKEYLFYNITQLEIVSILSKLLNLSEAAYTGMHLNITARLFTMSRQFSCICITIQL